jgi:hypothetical protein
MLSFRTVETTLRRANASLILFLGTLIVIVGSAILSYALQTPVVSLVVIARIAVAKCPGIPGGSNSGGPDYINITIDVGLVGLFCLFVMLTLKDMRKRRKLGAQDS